MGSWLENSTQTVLAVRTGCFGCYNDKWGRDGSCGLESRQDQSPSVFTSLNAQFHEPLVRFFKSSFFGIKLISDRKLVSQPIARPIPIGFLHAGFI
jgi:hypothetical protein